MRRFLPLVLPAFAIGVAASTAWLTHLLQRRSSRASALGARALVAIVLVSVFVPPALASASIPRARNQAGALTATNRLCRAVGDNGAVAVMPYASLGDLLPQTVRAFCGVPSASVRVPADAHLADDARAWAAVGRRLFVATSVPAESLDLGSGARLVEHVVVRDEYQPERTFTDRPRRYAPDPVEIWLYEIS
jgi:hypothetical protein